MIIKYKQNILETSNKTKKVTHSATCIGYTDHSASQGCGKFECIY